jgi:ribonuclease HI
LLNGLEILLDLRVDRADIFGDSQLVVHQMKGEMQCMDGMLNEYRERCLEMIGHMKEVHISHVSRKENAIANMLAQQASGCCV